MTLSNYNLNNQDAHILSHMGSGSHRGPVVGALLDWYGPEGFIEKHTCINHFQQREVHVCLPLSRQLLIDVAYEHGFLLCALFV